MLSIREQEGDRVVVEARERLDRQDYESIVPALEQQIRRSGRLRMLVRLSDFHGWTPSGLVEDLRFDVRHRHDIEKAAVVGDRRWEEIGAKLAAPIFDGEVRFFEDESAARTWLG